MPGGRGTPITIKDSLNSVTDDNVDKYVKMMIASIDNGEYRLAIRSGDVATAIQACKEPGSLMEIVCHAMNVRAVDWDLY